MITIITMILVAGLVSVIVVTVHEMFEHIDPADPLAAQRPGSDEQWHDLADAMRRYRKHRARGRDRDL